MNSLGRPPEEDEYPRIEHAALFQPKSRRESFRQVSWLSSQGLF
jgi:hypothetical protein